MIRAATHDDLPALVALGAFLHDESPRYRVRSFDPVRCGEHLRGLIDGAGVVFVADHAGVVVGGFAGGIAVDWFGSHKTAFDYSLMVHPEHRQGVVAVRLITAFKHWAKRMGADSVQMGVTTGIHDDNTARLYMALGFDRIGQLFEQGV
jgi:GNAT superfamily N-acetyltransferase